LRESILSVLARGELIICDGAMGTMLDSLGLPVGTLPELWNLENPDAVKSVHSAYAQAGAQIVTTNTCGGHRLRLKDVGLANEARRINRIAAELAREAVGDDVWVAGSVASTGHLLEPLGDLTIAAAEELYAEQVQGLAEGGADIILAETHFDIEESCAVVRMTKEHSDLPVFCTFSFNPKGRTIMGLRPAIAAQRALDAGASVVGANCGDGPEAIIAGLEGMQGVIDLPLMAQANAGIPRAGEHAAAVWDVTPEKMADYAEQFVKIGAQIVGGCCGTNPDFIAAIAHRLKG